MDYEISFVESGSFHLVKTGGEMNCEDFLRMGADLLRHEKFQAGGNVVFDHRRLDLSAVRQDTLDEIRGFHRENEEAIGAGKSAIVVGSGRVDAWNGLWRMGRKIVTSNRVEVFEDMDCAVKWINQSE